MSRQRASPMFTDGDSGLGSPKNKRKHGITDGKNKIVRHFLLFVIALSSWLL